MALTNIPQGTTLALKLQKGVSGSGSPVYVTRNYACKPDAADQDLFDVALGLVSLQTYPVVDIARVNTSMLVNM
jgi:hypothetical protein